MKQVVICSLIWALIGCAFGVMSERHAAQKELDEIEQVAFDSCEARIKIIKQTCK